MFTTLLITAALAQTGLAAVQTLTSSGQCLQVDGTPANGSPVTLGSCNSANSQMTSTGQQWVISSGNNAGVQLYGTNFCLNAQTNAAGGGINVADCAQSTSQTWYLTGDNRIAITGGTQCLDLSSTTPQTQNCAPNIATQAWTPTFLFDTPSSSSSAASASATNATSSATGAVAGGAASSAASGASAAGSAASSAASGASAVAGSATSGAASAASGAASGVSGAAGTATSGAASVANGATSAAGQATSGAGSVAGQATSGAGSVAGAATSAGGAATSALGSAAGAATSAVAGGGSSAGFSTFSMVPLSAILGVAVGATLLV
ncbi:uncharacterized protein L201_005878 [Kwoniella dendrophila CBS 6074]|uniref:Ricin B lectin domain-containing protein n=1 Tax=Kwoniella dendrophila CBS 6074 TaxID=1295534 RepID=A0AAX4JZX9_9TREE